ncbi:hypothetical protein J4573_52925 [Actinomadura barringtoniae]|uniref:Uncharacterized protein n=1 Tax=Actinomadura barringtoniae TaxID=1427535 RepID=A0A939PPQ1_9ACTN|nr:hypothetical protein [Actinomadura barringtoniae]MBO2455863.1 hypothetical protein [Actinomadura barringtoniae]
MDAAVLAMHAELVGADDAKDWRARAELTEEWATANDVELHPEWGGKVTNRWVWDADAGRVVRNLWQFTTR